MATAKKDIPTISFDSWQSWESWLEENHASANGVWLKLAKKDSGIASVSYPEALEVAICFGWIDGQKASFDETFWLQRFTPRRPGSKWSKINRDKATRLAEQRRLRAAGLAEVASAKEDGRWDNAYASQGNMGIPDDLQKRFDENPKARDFFAGLDSTNRYAVLYRIHDAKKPETRARRIEKFVQMLNERKTIY